MADFNFEIAMSLCKSNVKFPVDFEKAWVWLGYSKKDKALQLLKKHFVKDVDYALHQVGEWTVEGRTSDIYVLTVECFKLLGMMAGTEKGKAIRYYFLECEKTLKEQQNFQDYISDLLRSTVQDILAPELEEIRKFREACKDHKGAGQVIEANVEEKEYPIELITCHEYCAIHGVDRRLWNTFSRRYGRFTFAGKGLTPPKKKGRLAITGIFYEYADVILKNVMKCG
jgi:phage anti-repressor protein